MNNGIRMVSFVATLAWLLSAQKGVCGNVERNPRMGRLEFLWRDLDQTERLAATLGFTKCHIQGIGRDSRGEKLLIFFEAKDKSNMLAVVTSQGARLKSL